MSKNRGSKGWFAFLMILIALGIGCLGGWGTYEFVKYLDTRKAEQTEKAEDKQADTKVDLTENGVIIYA